MPGCGPGFTSATRTIRRSPSGRRSPRRSSGASARTRPRSRWKGADGVAREVGKASGAELDGLVIVVLTRLVGRATADLVLLEEPAEVRAVDPGGARRRGDVVPAALEQRGQIPALERAHR